MLILAIVCHVAPLSIDDSQCNIVPNCPVSVTTPLFVPEQTCVSLKVVPPTGPLSIVMLTLLEVDGHAAVLEIVHVN